MKEEIRLRNFLSDLDQLILDNEYYDDDLEKEVCTINEEEAYEIIMRTDEYHFLGEKKVKAFIDMFINDYPSRSAILREFTLF